MDEGSIFKIVQIAVPREQEMRLSVFARRELMLRGRIRVIVRVCRRVAPAFLWV